ncbi:MAG: sigma-70 family RNA polymerase sigma factor [Elusimicrobiota bacterium]
MDPEESECELRLRSGDPEAVRLIMKRFQRPLLSFLCNMTGDYASAEDLLQEVLVRVWRHRERYQAQERFSGWLFTIARRLALDHLEKAGRRRTIPLEEEGLEERVPEPDAVPDRALEGADLRRRIEEAIAALPEEQREVFLLREYGGLQFSEIARMTGAPLGTALARMRYAVLRLRKVLGDAYA